MSFEYNADGIRQSKTYGNTTVNYITDGSKIIAEYSGNTYTYYIYDENGTIMGMMYGGQMYTYRKNLQGDVTGIYNASGTLVAKYQYSPYGEILAITDGNGNDISANSSHIANVNPFRYRGYYYDTETGFYYLQSRYYDPIVGRFLSADSSDVLAATPMSLVDNNLYSYCDNNPITRADNDGAFWDTVFDVVSIALSVVEVCNKPDDPWAWAGLVGDVVDIIPFVTGVGETVKVISAANKAVNAIDTAHDVAKAADNIVDSAKAAKKGWNVGDDITTLTKAGNDPTWSTVRSRYWKNE